VSPPPSGPSARTPVDAQVLDEQLAYYRARAPEYDQWFERVGRYDHGPEHTRTWHVEVATVRGWLRDLQLAGRDVLELAPGTGIWTEVLLDDGATVTAVDGALEMLAQLRARVGARPLSTVHADLFDWTPPRAFDAIVSCFFMSHVPDERFDAFAAFLHSALHPDGQLFLLDGLREPTSAAVDHVLPERSTQTMLRQLDDGRTFTIVKRFREDDELVDAGARHGLKVTVRRTPTFFQVATGSRI
jgi:cyclopropane fatty-acyl-phospholipid synthase-like methyltransferase